MYACGFRIYFTPLPGFFSPFPHGTGALSVDYEYLALEDGPPIFRQDFSCPALLLATLVARSCFRIRGYHPLWPAFPDRFASSNANGCRLFRFRSPLLSESRLISFPLRTEMFQFRRLASRLLEMICLQHTRLSHSEIYGYNACVQLPVAYRSLPRPSSPLRPKASTMCP